MFMAASYIKANDILTFLIYAMLDDEGGSAFTDEQFRSGWQKLLGFFGSIRVATK
jgi:hypothetical protein